MIKNLISTVNIYMSSTMQFLKARCPAFKIFKQLPAHFSLVFLRINICKKEYYSKLIYLLKSINFENTFIFCLIGAFIDIYVMNFILIELH